MLQRTPTLGQEILYRPDTYAMQNPAMTIEGDKNTARLLGKIVHVWKDGKVNIVCWDHAANSFARTSVSLAPPGQEALAGHCEWIPPQVAGDGGDTMTEHPRPQRQGTNSERRP